MNGVGKYVLIALMVIGFLWFWPVGLAILCYLLWNNQLIPNDLRLPSWAGGSGNRSFDEHQEEARKRLDAEREAFSKFLDDKFTAEQRAEFDEFMKTQTAK